MQFLYWLESVRTEFGNWFFSTVTHLGDETAFLLIAILLFWCVNKRSGYFMMISGFFGTIINQVMKLACKIPRPWVKDPNFTIVESAREAATGYSFPSGHSQNGVNTFGAIFLTTKKLWLKILCIVAAILIPVSRMYLGVHTPWDVLAGAGCAVIILLLLEEFFKNDNLFKKGMPVIVALLTAGSIAFFIYAVVITPESADPNVISAGKNARTMLGCSAGLILVYLLETFVIKFETKAPWYSQVMKFVGGIAVVFAIKELAKIPLTAIMGDNERIVRYFLIVAFAGAVWPLTFKFFANLNIPVLNRFADKVGNLFAKNKDEEKAFAEEGEKDKKSSLSELFSDIKDRIVPKNKKPVKYNGSVIHVNKDYRKVNKQKLAHEKRNSKKADTGIDDT